jgi:hypothetical protein
MIGRPDSDHGNTKLDYKILSSMIAKHLTSFQIIWSLRPFNPMMLHMKIIKLTLRWWRNIGHDEWS